jgi:hypothetical protein
MNIDYQTFLDESMLEFIKKLLMKVQKEGLQSDYYFHISFRTNDPFVILSDIVKERYPKEVTIIFQYQFDNLVVNQDGFSVNMAFNGRPETINIPFRSIIGFVDPTIKFSLHLNNVNAPLSLAKSTQIKRFQKLSNISNECKRSSNVIILDKFRNKDEIS